MVIINRGNVNVLVAYCHILTISTCLCEMAGDLYHVPRFHVFPARRRIPGERRPLRLADGVSSTQPLRSSRGASRRRGNRTRTASGSIDRGGGEREGPLRAPDHPPRSRRLPLASVRLLTLLQHKARRHQTRGKVKQEHGSVSARIRPPCSLGIPRNLTTSLSANP
jgi:hypothetical protein